MHRPALSALLAAALTTGAAAEIPRTLSFQGRLLGDEGTPLVGPQQVTLEIFTTREGGEPISSETDVVRCDAQGVFVTTIGDHATLDVDDFTRPLWVGVTIDLERGGKELPGRVELHPVPYALRALRASSLGMVPARVGAGDSPHRITEEAMVSVHDALPGALDLVLPPPQEAPGRQVTVTIDSRGPNELRVDVESPSGDLMRQGAVLSTPWTCFTSATRGGALFQFVSDGSAWYVAP